MTRNSSFSERAIKVLSVFKFVSARSSFRCPFGP